MLKIENLCVNIGEKKILKNFNLVVEDGDVVSLMGPNGIGKSTCLKVLMGDPTYEVVSGTITYNGEDLLSLSASERAKRGLYIINQNPIEIPGVSNADMLRSALECRTGERINFFEFNKKVNEVCKKINMNPAFIHRGINDGMSGGEKKKNELLHLYILEPKLILLDELDSGLDVDALKEIGLSLKEYIKDDISVIIVTHHTSILEYITPNKVYVIKDGNIKLSGDYELAKQIEKNGFRLDEVSE